MDDKKQKKTQSASEDTSRNETSPGNRSLTGSTSTNPDKQRLQTVESNELDTNANEGDGGRENVSGSPASEREQDSRLGSTERGFTEDLVDQGSVRTAAFDEGNEPRSKDSLENRGTTQGSDDSPKPAA